MSVAVVEASQPLAAQASATGDLWQNGCLPHAPPLMRHCRDCGRQQRDTFLTSSGGNRKTTFWDSVNVPVGDAFQAPYHGGIAYHKEDGVNVARFAGGLLICLPREQAAAYCKDIEKQEGYQAWIIGIVEKGCRTARIIDKPRVIEVPSKDKDGELW